MYKINDNTTTHVVLSLILYMSGETYSLTSIPNDRILRNIFVVGLFTLRVFARNVPRGNRRGNIFFLFHTSSWCLTWYTNLGFTSNKPTHNLLDYGVQELRSFNRTHICVFISASNFFLAFLSYSFKTLNLLWRLGAFEFLVYFSLWCFSRHANFH